ncbi:ATP-binding protein [Flavisphingomonas formosensis]|uniref:ATP-binding protein n=1 Tax=Flavisphingomonas formosensis TaxID=861534 RepID=UPI0012F98486|nr:ATP-binding protein [Sphingomonas formosensis]
MKSPFSGGRWRGPPLMFQILALLLGGLVIAQLVTLLLTLLLPPSPSPQHSLASIAAALRGEQGRESRPDGLERAVQPGPPDLGGTGWIVSERAKVKLADLLETAPDDIRLAFYTPLPFAGTAAAPKLTLATDGPILPLKASADGPRAWLLRVAMQVPGGNMGTATRFPGSAPTRDSLPPGMQMGWGRPRGTGAETLPGDVQGGLPPEGPLFRIDPGPRDGNGGTWLPGDGGAAVPPLLQMPRAAARAHEVIDKFTAPLTSQSSTMVQDRLQTQRSDLLPAEPTPPVVIEGDARPGPRADPSPIRIPAPLAPAVPVGVEARHSTEAMPPPAPPVVVAPRLGDIRSGAEDQGSGEALVPLTPRAGGLFGLAPAPFVEGSFVAAMRMPDGRWAVVQPSPEPFPNAWQRRVLLWFLIAFAIVAPIGWLFARRIVRPLASFAETAERLGRDPSAPVLALDGPAEIGRAARAFNAMQSRLRSFVGDRTAMVGAISHDLRTPLTRLRFRIEEVEDDHIREGMIEEVEEMEAMITSVLNFIRDASTPGVRERLDLQTIVEDVVEDAAIVGSDVSIEAMQEAPVEVDVLGIRRVLANLVDNAVKYGARARLRLHVNEEEVIVDVLDDGPGVPPGDLERAFEPFYRAPDIRASGKRGSGLGLAVCRSIARAHGGDTELLKDAQGFTARLRLPLFRQPERRLAA